MKKTLTLFALLLGISMLSQAAVIDSSFYDFKIHIKGFKAPKAYLGYYFGEETFVLDSAKVDSVTGAMRFTRNRVIPEGLYFIANTEGVVVMDFIVNGWKDFTIKTELNTPIASAEIIRSDENAAYFTYLKEFQKLKWELDSLEKNTILKKTISDDELKDYYRKLKSLEHLHITFIHQYSHLWAAQLVQAQLNISTKSPIKAKSHSLLMMPDSPQSSMRMGFASYPFWENFDFTDSRLLYSTIYISKLKEFVSVLGGVSEDLQKKYCDALLTKSQSNNRFYQITLNWLMRYLESHPSLPHAHPLLEHLACHYIKQ